MWNNVAVEEKEEDIKKEYTERFRKFCERYNTFSETISKYVLFYEDEINRMLIEVRNLCNIELINFKLYFFNEGNRIKFNYEKSENRKNEIINKVSIITKLIRKRIRDMKIKD